jgi:hypothetical protein
VLQTVLLLMRERDHPVGHAEIVADGKVVPTVADESVDVRDDRDVKEVVRPYARYTFQSVNQLDPRSTTARLSTAQVSSRLPTASRTLGATSEAKRRILLSACNILMLARVVAAPRFHKIVGATLSLLAPPFLAAFVGLPGFPPHPPRAVALFAAVRHATGLHCGQSSRARSTVAAISVSCSSSSPITSEKPQRVLELDCAMLHTSPGRADEYKGIRNTTPANNRSCASR